MKQKKETSGKKRDLVTSAEESSTDLKRRIRRVTADETSPSMSLTVDSFDSRI